MKLFFRHSEASRGREVVINCGNSPLKYLSYARISLTRENPEAKILSSDRETVIMCVRGRCRAKVGSFIYELGFQDALYLPRGWSCTFETSEKVELVEGSAPSNLDRDPAISLFSEVEKHPINHRAKGDLHKGTFRDSYVHFGPDFEASSILLGLARIRPGNWSSWPPHEHMASLEEVYIYYDMPSPAFGIQLVYKTIENPLFCGIVRDGDAVVVSEGYHPCVSAPQYSANYIWILAAKEKERRSTSPNVQADFL